MKGMAKCIGLIMLGVGFIFLGGATWTEEELSKEINLMDQEAGEKSGRLEISSLNIIKRPKTNSPCDWKSEQRIREDIVANEAKYRRLVAEARTQQGEKGRVYDTTTKSILDLATDFNDLCRQYAQMWSACGFDTRAELAKAVGQARLLSVAILVGTTKAGDKVEVITEAMDEVMMARRSYVIKVIAGDEIDDRDKMAIKQEFIPEVDKLIKEMTDFHERAASLSWEIQRRPTGGGSGPSGGNQGGREGGDGLSPERRKLRDQGLALRNIGQRMIKNAQELKIDAEGLVSGRAPEEIQPGSWLPKACFTGSADE